jgi:undecaprenyl-diphosphatase
VLENLRIADYIIATKLNAWAISSDWTRFIVIFCARYLILAPILVYLYLFLRKRINAIIVGFVGVALAFFIDYLFMLGKFRLRPFASHSSIIPLDKDVTVASSFPSTHMAVAFAIATAIYLYGHRRLGPALFLLAFVIGFGRVAAGVHYPIDILAGAIVGGLSGIVAKFFIEYALAVHRRNHQEE